MYRRNIIGRTKEDGKIGGERRAEKRERRRAGSRNKGGGVCGRGRKRDVTGGGGRG